MAYYDDETTKKMKAALMHLTMMSNSFRPSTYSKVNAYAFREATHLFSILLPFSVGGQLLKKSFPDRADPLWKDFVCQLSIKAATTVFFPREMME